MKKKKYLLFAIIVGFGLSSCSIDEGEDEEVEVRLNLTAFVSSSQETEFGQAGQSNGIGLNLLDAVTKYVSLDEIYFRAAGPYETGERTFYSPWENMGIDNVGLGINKIYSLTSSHLSEPDATNGGDGLLDGISCGNTYPTNISGSQLDDGFCSDTLISRMRVEAKAFSIYESLPGLETNIVYQEAPQGFGVSMEAQQGRKYYIVKMPEDYPFADFYVVTVTLTLSTGEVITTTVDSEAELDFAWFAISNEKMTEDMTFDIKLDIRERGQDTIVNSFGIDNAHEVMGVIPGVDDCVTLFVTKESFKYDRMGVSFFMKWVIENHIVYLGDE